jgi:hypothetical protein
MSFELTLISTAREELRQFELQFVTKTSYAH